MCITGLIGVWTRWTGYYWSNVRTSDMAKVQMVNILGVGEVNLYDPLPGVKYFTWHEVTRGGTRLPETAQVTANLIKLCTEADGLREHLGEPMWPTSIYRPSRVNNAIPGAAPNSRHVTGEAMDFYCEGLTDHQLHTRTKAYWGDRGGVGFYNGRVHIDVRGYSTFWDVRRW